MRTLLTGLLGALLGGLLVAAFGPSASRPEAPRPDAISQARVPAADGPARAPAPRAPDGATGRGAATGAADGRSPGQREAFDAYVALLAAAGAKGAWEPRDMRAIRGLLPRLGFQDRRTAMASIAVEINEGRLALRSPSAF